MSSDGSTGGAGLRSPKLQTWGEAAPLPSLPPSGLIAGSCDRQCRGQRVVVLDGRNRVLLPLGVRHQIGLDGAVLVSVALDQSLLVVWPASRLDNLLEER
jgi:hypothetical protein